MLRDLLVREIPVVLRADFYALAALAGAAMVVAGNLLHLALVPTATVSVGVCFLLRFLAIRRGWNLPVAGQTGGDPTGSSRRAFEREE